jgi:hypothetical protein
VSQRALLTHNTNKGGKLLSYFILLAGEQPRFAHAQHQQRRESLIYAALSILPCLSLFLTPISNANSYTNAKKYVVC